MDRPGRRKNVAGMAHNRCTHTYRGTMLVYSTSLILPIWKGGPSASTLLSIRARGLGTGDEQLHRSALAEVSGEFVILHRILLRHSTF